MGEDWGWFIEYLDGETEMIIGCGSEAAEGEGYLGKPITWYVFIKPSRSLKPWFQGKAAPAIITPLTEAIIAVLKAEGIMPTVAAT